MASQIEEFNAAAREFSHESSIFIQRCIKPTRKEWMNYATTVATGIVVMGGIGFFVKLSKPPAQPPAAAVLVLILKQSTSR